MKTALPLLVLLLLPPACSKPADSAGGGGAAPARRESPLPQLDPKNIVSIAVGSKDHATLVTALKAADYVASVANPGPLTVFAPTNAAFDKLPPGTVESLLLPEKVDDLREILKYHVTTSVYEQHLLTDGMMLAMANGAKAKISKQDGKLKINDATVLASIRGSNGVVHVLDGVLLPPAK